MIGIHLLYQTFFKKKVKSYKKHRQYNLKVIVSGLLVFSCFSLGVVMLFFGIRDTYRFFQATKGYVTTDGVFSDYEIYSDNGAEVTYQLTYTYRVDGIVYTIKTDYGTDYIPDRNSVREVRYNSNHPEEAVLVGSNNKNILIYFGAFFTLVSLTFVMAIFTTLGYFDKCRIDVMQTYIGVVFLIVGIGVICFQTGITGSVVKSIQSLGIFIMVPILFIIVGGMQIIKGVFSRDKKCHQDVKLEV